MTAKTNLGLCIRLLPMLCNCEVRVQRSRYQRTRLIEADASIGAA